MIKIFSYLQLDSSRNIWDEDDDKPDKEENKVLVHHDENKLDKGQVFRFLRDVTFSATIIQ